MKGSASPDQVILGEDAKMARSGHSVAGNFSPPPDVPLMSDFSSSGEARVAIF
jgi:hypothetical protein